MVPNDPGGDRKALRPFSLLQHVRCNTYPPPFQSYLPFFFAGFAEILVRCLLASKRNHRLHTCFRSRCLRSMGRAPPLLTSPKSTHRNPTPILSGVQTVRNHNASASGLYISTDAQLVMERCCGSNSKTMFPAPWQGQTCERTALTSPSCYRGEASPLPFPVLLAGRLPKSVTRKRYYSSTRCQLIRWYTSASDRKVLGELSGA